MRSVLKENFLLKNKFVTEKYEKLEYAVIFNPPNRFIKLSLIQIFK